MPQQANERYPTDGQMALEPLFQIGISREVLGEHFDGDGAVQAGVAGLIQGPRHRASETGSRPRPPRT